MEDFADKAKNLSHSKKQEIRGAVADALSRGIVLTREQIDEAVATMIYMDELFGRD